MTNSCLPLNAGAALGHPSPALGLGAHGTASFASRCVCWPCSVTPCGTFLSEPVELMEEEQSNICLLTPGSGPSSGQKRGNMLRSVPEYLSNLGHVHLATLISKTSPLSNLICTSSDQSLKTKLSLRLFSG